MLRSRRRARGGRESWIFDAGIDGGFPSSTLADLGRDPLRHQTDEIFFRSVEAIFARFEARETERSVAGSVNSDRRTQVGAESECRAIEGSRLVGLRNSLDADGSL